jgi:hypothetical protein
MKFIRPTRIFPIFVGFFLLFLALEGLPCTLFGAIGSSVEGGGVLIGKTRDRPKSLEQVWMEVPPKGGYAYRGISTRGVKGVTSGINEKGLIVISAAASNVEKEGAMTTVGKILSKASCVEDVITSLKRGEIQGPIHFLVGDIHKIALLEVIDGLRHEVLVKENGVLCHTNHFILKDMRHFNREIGISSGTRLNRMEGLLDGGPFTKDRFILFAQDHKNGPGNNSICRHFESGARGSERTVSAAVYFLPGEGTPEIWVSLGQPCRSIFQKIP